MGASTQDMINLRTAHPLIADEFHNGNFTVHAVDQAHKQNNAAVKSDSGAIGLTQNPETICKNGECSN